VTYLLLKALHLACLIVWIGGSVTLFLIADRGVPLPVAAGTVRRLWTSVTSVAMLGAWTAGLAAAQYAGVFDATWLRSKLVLAVLISGWHGAVSGRLRRLETASETSLGSAFRASAALCACLVLLAISAAVVKPN
jgi:uncharacterized membrane protein